MAASTAPAQRGLHALDIDECLLLLGQHYVGRVAFVREGRPVLLPVNYLLHQGAVTFRIAFGTALDDLIGQWVAFEIDEVDDTYHTGWSVVVHGSAEEVWKPDDLAVVRALPLRPWAPGTRDHYIRILSTAVTGRRIT
jgi:uncharacterized protein